MRSGAKGIRQIVNKIGAPKRARSVLSNANAEVNRSQTLGQKDDFWSSTKEYAVFCGIDVGKTSHHAVVLRRFEAKKLVRRSSLIRRSSRTPASHNAEGRQSDTRGGDRVQGR